MKKLALILSFVMIFALLTGCGSHKANGLEKVTLVLDWVPNTNHTGIYMAKALGYYEEAGIDLEILQPSESDGPALVASGNAEYGIGFQESLGLAYTLEEPLPITTIAAVVSHNTSGFISASSANIKSPKDFENKKLVVWDTPVVINIIKDLVTADGGDFDKVELIFNNVSDPIQLLQSDDVIIWGYYAWDYTNAKLEGLEVDFLNIAEINPVFDFYTPVIIANNHYRENNPEHVKKFLAATSKGYNYAIENPQEAAKKLVEMVPGLDESLITASQEYLSTQYTADASRWGKIDEARWDNFYDWMYEKEIIDKKVPSGMFTNKYLP